MATDPVKVFQRGKRGPSLSTPENTENSPSVSFEGCTCNRGNGIGAIKGHRRNRQKKRRQTRGPKPARNGTGDILPVLSTCNFALAEKFR